MGPGDNGADQEQGFNSEDAENLIDHSLSSYDEQPELNLPSDDVDDSLVLDSGGVTEELPDEGSHTNLMDYLDNWNDKETLDGDPPEPNLPSHDVDDSLVLNSGGVTEDPPDPPDEGSHNNALDNLDNWSDEETLDDEPSEQNLPSHEVDEYLCRVSVLGS